MNHETEAINGFERVDVLVSTPLSEVDAADFHNKLEEEKSRASVICGDVRDAKRRITAVKGPQKRRDDKVKKEPSNSDSDC